MWIHTCRHNNAKHTGKNSADISSEYFNCSQKLGFDISNKLGENLQEVLNPLSWTKYKKISICNLLNLPIGFYVLIILFKIKITAYRQPIFWITKLHLSWNRNKNILTFTTLWANSASNKLMIFFLENGVWHFMQIVSNGDNLHEMSNHVSWKN